MSNQPQRYAVDSRYAPVSQPVGRAAERWEPDPVGRTRATEHRTDPSRPPA